MPEPCSCGDTHCPRCYGSSAYANTYADLMLDAMDRARCGCAHALTAKQDAIALNYPHSWLRHNDFKRAYGYLLCKKCRLALFERVRGEPIPASPMLAQWRKWDAITEIQRRSLDT